MLFNTRSFQVIFSLIFFLGLSLKLLGSIIWDNFKVWKAFALKIAAPKEKFLARAQCDKTFHVRNLRIFVLSYSVCPSQVSSAWSNVRG
jgi:hypothetical protein